MYVSTSQEVLRQHREEIMHEVSAARQAGTRHVNREGERNALRGLRWELAGYAGLLGKRFRNAR